MLTTADEVFGSKSATWSGISPAVFILIEGTTWRE
jgi:hypothetical protein